MCAQQIRGKVSLERAKTWIEILMMKQPSSIPESERRQYRAGYIDAWFECGKITEATREKLYQVYGVR